MLRYMFDSTIEWTLNGNWRWCDFEHVLQMREKKRFMAFGQPKWNHSELVWISSFIFGAYSETFKLKLSEKERENEICMKSTLQKKRANERRRKNLPWKSTNFAEMRDGVGLNSIANQLRCKFIHSNIALTANQSTFNSAENVKSAAAQQSHVAKMKFCKLKVGNYVIYARNHDHTQSQNNWLNELFGFESTDWHRRRFIIDDNDRQMALQSRAEKQEFEQKRNKIWAQKFPIAQMCKYNPGQILLIWRWNLCGTNAHFYSIDHCYRSLPPQTIKIYFMWWFVHYMHNDPLCIGSKSTLIFLPLLLSNDIFLFNNIFVSLFFLSFFFSFILLFHVRDRYIVFVLNELHSANVSRLEFCRQ